MHTNKETNKFQGQRKQHCQLTAGWCVRQVAVWVRASCCVASPGMVADGSPLSCGGWMNGSLNASPPAYLPHLCPRLWMIMVARGKEQKLMLLTTVNVLGFRGGEKTCPKNFIIPQNMKETKEKRPFYFSFYMYYVGLFVIFLFCFSL